MQTISAQPGWNIVTPQSMHATVRTTMEIYREPVLAWHMVPTGVKGKLLVFPVTVNGTVSTPDIIFEKPDNSYIQPGVDFWRDADDMLAYFEDLAEAQDDATKL